MQTYDTLILAGGRTPWLKPIIGHECRSLLQLNDNYMLSYILKALRASGRIRNIVLAASPEALPLLAKVLPTDVLLCPAGSDLPNTALLAAEALGDDCTKRVLTVCDDIPFLTAESIQDFLTQCEAFPEGELYYPIIPKEAAEKAFPGAKRTYAKLANGTFTGGNMMFMQRDVLIRGKSTAAQVYALRKSPFQLANWLGWSFIIKFLLHNCSIASVETRFHELSNIRAKAIITEYAEIGMDVDKPIDYKQAQSYLRRNL